MELLTVNETAQRPRLTPITVRRYIASGRLPAVRVGRRVCVREEAAKGLAQPLKPKRQPPRRPRRSPRIPRGRPFTMDDPLWNIIGIGRSDGPDDVSSHKHQYLADAYAATADLREDA